MFDWFNDYFFGAEEFADKVFVAFVFATFLVAGLFTLVAWIGLRMI